MKTIRNIFLPAVLIISGLPLQITFAIDNHTMEKGKKIYQENCLPCHGATGGGDGPAAAVLKPKPRNFKEGKFLYGDTMAALKKTVKNGVNGTAMPAWGPTLKEKEIEAVIHYVKSLKTQ